MGQGAWGRLAGWWGWWGLLDPRGAGERAAHLHHTPVISPAICSPIIIIVFIVVVIIYIIFINLIIIMIGQQAHVRTKSEKTPLSKTIFITVPLQPPIQFFLSQKKTSFRGPHTKT